MRSEHREQYQKVDVVDRLEKARRAWAFVKRGREMLVVEKKENQTARGTVEERCVCCALFALQTVDQGLKKEQRQDR